MKLSILFCLLAALTGITPKPQSVTPAKGRCKVAGVPVKCDAMLDGKTLDMIAEFAADLSLASGKTSSTSAPMGLKATVESGSAKGLVFVLEKGMAPESYSIDITKKATVVKASDFNGFLYAVQTIKQLLPVNIYSGTYKAGCKFVLPCGSIQDAPRFAYRGAHLDSARHFWKVEEVKKYLRAMAMYKMNKFHWHLTEDQGWRVEIRKYPLLTEKGSIRKGTQVGYNFSENDGIPYGQGLYYTQDDIREVVEYAAGLGIDVIPEIDLPGHMLAALSCYPWLGCTGGPYEVSPQWGVFPDVLCAGKESTFKFLEDVIDEFCELFPYEYFHIGGDECPKDRWCECPDCQKRIKELGIKGNERFTKEQFLQTYVTNRIQKYLATKGKKIIGWDEILEGELGEGATVMSWRGLEGGIEAAAKGFNAIMTPSWYCYLDYCQHEDTELEPPCIGSYLPIERCYSYEPYEGMMPGTTDRILGVQCNLWTEYLVEEAQLEYMFLPRMIAISEVQWSPQGSKDWERFKSDLIDHQFPILDETGYTYSKVILGIHGYEK